MRKMAAETAPGQENLPVALTEFNILNASPTQTIQLINGLFTAEALGEAIKVGYAAANYWDWKNGIDTKLNGDMGMLALRDNNTKDDTPRPSYYAYALYDKAFGDKMVEAVQFGPGLQGLRQPVFHRRVGPGPGQRERRQPLGQVRYHGIPAQGQADGLGPGGEGTQRNPGQLERGTGPRSGAEGLTHWTTSSHTGESSKPARSYNCPWHLIPLRGLFCIENSGLLSV